MAKVPINQFLRSDSTTRPNAGAALWHFTGGLVRSKHRPDQRGPPPAADGTLACSVRCTSYESSSTWP